MHHRRPPLNRWPPHKRENTMHIKQHLREAIIAELGRQADISGPRLTVEVDGEQIVINGAVNLDELVMVIAGSLAGGP